MIACHVYIQFKFNKCSKEQEAADVDFLEDLEEFEDDEDINQNQQMFDFVDVPSFVSLFTGNQAEPLYFVKVTETGIAIKDMKD